nr:MAG TPA: hypothetical protein [Caudoviricetes sp.]
MSGCASSIVNYNSFCRSLFGGFASRRKATQGV